MEGKPSFERVIGSNSDAEQEKILREAGERFDDQAFESLKDKEREKTPDEFKMISLANAATNEIRRKYGLDDFNVPADNIHVIKKEAWWKEKSSGVFVARLQGVAIEEGRSKSGFMKTAFHEMVHFKSYHSLQLTAEENPELLEYRMGLVCHSRDGKDMYFKNLNEAITEEITKRYAKKFVDEDLFKEEVEQTRKIMRDNPDAITESGSPLFNGDVFYAEILNELPNGQLEISVDRFTYPSERKILNILIEKILARNSDKFKNKDEVFEVFEKAMITGQILPVGRLIDETFGPGTLRRIGELDEDIQAQRELVDKL